MRGYGASLRQFLDGAYGRLGDKLRRGVWLALAGALALAPAAAAQTVAVAQLSGSVTDESGAAIPGVEVNVTQTETGSTRSAVTDERGQYSLPSLPVGPYKLTATLPGFST